ELSGNGMSGKPFIGYIFVLGHHKDNLKGGTIKVPLFEVDNVFIQREEDESERPTDYKDRIEVLIRRLVESRLYTTGTLIISDPNVIEDYIEPREELGYYQFIARMLGDIVSKYHVLK